MAVSGAVLVLSPEISMREMGDDPGYYCMKHPSSANAKSLQLDSKSYNRPYR